MKKVLLACSMLCYSHVALAQFTPGGAGSSGPAASATPALMDGVASVGTSGAYARADHVHPSDTSRALAGFSAKVFGAIADGASHPVSTVLGLSTKAAIAAYTVNGSQPYAFITNALYQYASQARLAVAAASGATQLQLVNSSNMPAGATISGPGIAAGTTISANPVPAQVNTTTSAAVSNNATIPLSSTTGIVIGSYVVPGGAVPYNTYVQSVNSGTSVTLTNAVSGTLASGASFSCQPPQTTITLSTPTTAQTYQGQTFSVTAPMTDAQAASLEMDWLAVQAAIVACTTAGGGAVICPAGSYRFNWTLVRREASASLLYYNQGTRPGGIDIVGDAAGGTLFFWPTDLGAGRYAFSCGDPSGTFTNGLGRYGFNYYYGTIRNITFAGPINYTALGVAPVAMSGICWGARQRLERVSTQFFYAGISMAGDHCQFYDVNSLNNYYNLYMDESNTGLYGDLSFQFCDFSGANFAGVAVHPAAHLDCSMSNSYPGGNPYHFYKEPGTSAPNYDPILLAGLLFHCNLEWAGNGVFYDGNGETTSNGIVSAGTKVAVLSSLTVDNCYMSWSPGNPADILPYRPKRSLIDVGKMNGVRFRNHPSMSGWQPGTAAFICVGQIGQSGGGLLIEGDVSALVYNVQQSGLPIFLGSGNNSQMLCKITDGGEIEATVWYSNTAVSQYQVVETNGYIGAAVGGTTAAAPPVGIAAQTISAASLIIVYTKHPNITCVSNVSLTAPSYVKKGTGGSVTGCTGSGGTPAAGEYAIGKLLTGYGSGPYYAQIALFPMQ